MERMNLGGEWKLTVLKENEENEIFPAIVPGSVYSDLLREGRMEDPYYRDNEDAARAWMDNDFLYERTFTIEEKWFGLDRILLQCRCLDTVAEVRVNGQLLGKSDSMHRTYVYDVTCQVHSGENSLQILLKSPTKEIKKRYAECPAEGTSDAMKGFPTLRKAHYMFGWDWGPKLPDAGIREDICLLGVKYARMEQVRVQQIHSENKVDLKLQMVALLDTGADYWEETAKEILTNPRKVRFHAVVTNPAGNVVATKDVSGIQMAKSQTSEGKCTISIENPELWWPNDLGEQPLYSVEVEAWVEEPSVPKNVECVVGTDKGSAPKEILVDTWKRRIGLRVLDMERKKDEWGESFAQMANGVTYFAMGADYIPEDNIYGRLNKERTKRLLMDCKNSHFNSIRVWGGGYYPTDYFYDLCDELGLVVWQDFMFACATYELDDHMEENITAEVRENLRRIRHHACIGLYSGNNEMEQFVKEGTWLAKPKHFADYFKMYEYIFPKIMKEEAPDAFYWPSSASSGGSLDFPQDPNRGDIHFWEVWHGNKPFTEYRKHFFRYVSEFGFESFPCEKTVESFTLPEERNPFSYIMERHQKCVGGNGKILNYLYQTFMYPNSFSGLIYASQLLQAEAIKYGVEHFRRNRGRCMGAVYWQLNDCWPVASWASIDYAERWKALQYFAKRFFAPVLLSCQEEGMLSANIDINAEPKPFEKSVLFNVSNETREEHELTITWQLRTAAGDVIKSSEQFVTVKPMSTLWLDKEEYPDADPYSEFVSYQMSENGKVITSGSVLFTVPKFFKFQNPYLEVMVEDDELVVTSKAYARSVELQNEDQTLKLEDNFFDLVPGEERRIKVVSGKAEGVRVRSVYDIR